MHVKTVLIFSFIFVGSFSRAEIRTIEDFGGKADGVTDNGPALGRAFAFAKDHPGTTLRLGGVCRISAPQANDGVGQIRDQKYKMAAELVGAVDFTIEDGEIILGGGFGAFYFDHCKGLTLKNVVFDYDPPIISQGKILAANRADGTVTLRPDPSYPSPGSELFSPLGHTWFTVHKPGGEYGFFFVGFSEQSEDLGNGKVRLTYTRPDLAAELDRNDITGWKYARMQRKFGHLNVFRFCDDVRLEGCSIHAASAFASLFVFCNDVVLLGNRICPRDGSGQMVSTCADGFHFIGGRRGPRIENNFFDRLQDDNIVISLRGNQVKSVNGAQLELEKASVTWYQTGDIIEVVETETGRRAEYTIVAMSPQKNIYHPPVMTLDRPVAEKIVAVDDADPEALPTLVFNRSWRQDGTVIRGNVFQNTRRYAVFMGAGGVCIENNVMQNHIGSAILCSYIESLRRRRPELIYYLSRDVVIQNNTIINAFNYGEGGRVFNQPCGAIDVYDFDRTDIGAKQLRLLRDISILDNRIMNSGTAGIRVANASGVILSGNTILNPNRQLQDDRYGIIIEASDNVTLTNNSFFGSGIDEPVHQVE